MHDEGLGTRPWNETVSGLWLSGLDLVETPSQKAGVPSMNGINDFEMRIDHSEHDLDFSFIIPLRSPLMNRFFPL